MAQLTGKVAWVTGAGSGIGQAAAIALARDGASVVLTGRRAEPLQATARTIGNSAVVEAVDMADAATVMAVGARIKAKFGRLDVMVNNAGVNVVERRWKELDLARAKAMIDGNLTSALNGVMAALPMMRAQGDGLIVNVSSVAGRRVGYMSGPLYVTAKHAVCAMTETINLEEGPNGIRATAVCPGEVATPILDQRPVPVSAEDRAKMLQSADLGEIILFLARLPKHVCINDLMVTPTWNRGNIAQMNQPHVKRG
jgi:NADP-dependent 3-hydroxy acid dehydrogenase YdfG